MLKHFLRFLPVALLIVHTANARAVYVSAKASSGGDGTLDSPFATIQEAMDEISAGDTCWVRAGTYRERVTAKSSGTLDRPIVIAGFEGEWPLFTGCDKIESPWTIHEGAIYKTPLPWDLGRGMNQVFVDRIPMAEARFPNENADTLEVPHVTYSYYQPWWMSEPRLHPHNNPLDYPVDECNDPRVVNLYPIRGDFHMASQQESRRLLSPLLASFGTNDWVGGVYIGGHYEHWGLQPAAIVSSSSTEINVSNSDCIQRWWFPWFAPVNFTRENGMIYGHWKAFDKEEEWLIDDGNLYLWSPESDDPAGHLVEVKRRQVALDLSDQSNFMVKHLFIFGAAALLRNSSNCVFDSCHLMYTSHYMFYKDMRAGCLDGVPPGENGDASIGAGCESQFDGRVGVLFGGSRNVFRNSSIRYSAGAGIIMTGVDHTVDNSLLTDCSYIATYPSTIYMTPIEGEQSSTPRGGFTVQNSTLLRSGKTIFHWQSHWKDTFYKACTIRNNHIGDAGLNGNDTGLFYCWHVDADNTQIYNNVIHDFWNHWGSDTWGGQIYLDNATYNFTFRENIFYYSPGACPRIYLFNQPGGNRNYDNNSDWTNNQKLANYTGGIAGLEASDYPGGTVFEVGHDWGEPPATPNEFGELYARKAPGAFFNNNYTAAPRKLLAMRGNTGRHSFPDGSAVYTINGKRVPAGKRLTAKNVFIVTPSAPAEK